METANHRLQLLLEDLDAADGGLVALYHDDAFEWALQYEDETVIHLTWRGEHSRIELACAVAPLPESADGDLLKALLMCNLLSDESGGTRLALSAPDKMVMLIRDLEPESLELPALKDSLDALRSRAMAVQSYLREWQPAVRHDPAFPQTA